jgi:lysophospholipase L1-like esterase
MRPRLLLLRLGIALGATIVALLVAEGVARLVGFGATPPVVRNPPVAFVDVEDEALVFVNRPDSPFESVYAYADGRPPLVVRGTTNRLGFRGADVPQAKAGTRRIACLGDSYTFGEGVGDDETWPAQLEPALERARPGVELEVLNCGVNAYDTPQEVRLLETQVLQLAPDVVLLAFFLNDAAIRAEDTVGGFEYGEPSALYRMLTAREPIRTLRKGSRLVDGLADRIVRREYLDFLGESRSSLYSQDSQGWRQARAELLRAKELCAARGIEFAVVLYPLLFRRGDVLATHGAYEIVGGFCRENGILVLDLEPAFAGHDVDALRVHPADSHPNAEGHRIAADAIAAFLVDAGLAGRP